MQEVKVAFKNTKYLETVQKGPWKIVHDSLSIFIEKGFDFFFIFLFQLQSSIIKHSSPIYVEHQSQSVKVLTQPNWLIKTIPQRMCGF